MRSAELEADGGRNEIRKSSVEEGKRLSLFFGFINCLVNVVFGLDVKEEYRTGIEENL